MITNNNNDNNEREKRVKRREARKRLNSLHRGLSLEELEKEAISKGIVQRCVKTRLQTGKISRINYKE